MNWRLRLAVAGAIVGVAALGFACSDDGGGTLTLEEYFEELQERDEQFEDESAQLDSAFETEDLDEIKSAVEAGTSATADFIDDLEGLNPPDEAQEAHEEGVAAGNEFLGALEQFNDEVQDAESIDALESNDFDAIGSASDRFNAACVDLEGIAAENDIEVDLNCEESE